MWCSCRYLLHHDCMPAGRYINVLGRNQRALRNHTFGPGRTGERRLGIRSMLRTVPRCMQTWLLGTGSVWLPQPMCFCPLILQVQRYLDEMTAFSNLPNNLA